MGEWYLELRKPQAGHVGTRRNVLHLKLQKLNSNVFSHVWLFVTPWTVAHRASLFMAILQARILEWLAMPSSRGSSQPRDQTQVSRTAGGFFTVWVTRKPMHPGFLAEWYWKCWCFSLGLRLLVNATEGLGDRMFELPPRSRSWCFLCASWLRP